MSRSDLAGAILTIDLDSIVANYRLLRDRVGGRANCAAVVKANAYGLGMEKVAPAIAAAGCKVFFVAHIEEGIALRRCLPDVEIHVFHGILPGTAPAYAEHRLIPVLGSLGEIEAWAKFSAGHQSAPPADIHIDTGMARLGLPPEELEVLIEEQERLRPIDVSYALSHLACADEPDNPVNRRQLEAFIRARSAIPASGASFANSSGVFLGGDYHFDLARPGISLYGGTPNPEAPNPMAQVVRLQAKILQIRDVDTPQTVGYGATYSVDRRRRIATVVAGYADGYPRSLSNAGCGYIGDIRVPIVGRVSMDLITLDVTGVPLHQVQPGGLVDMIGPHNPIDSVAVSAGTISNEVLTCLGARYHRVYTGGL